MNSEPALPKKGSWEAVFNWKTHSLWMSFLPMTAVAMGRGHHSQIEAVDISVVSREKGRLASVQWMR